MAVVVEVPFTMQQHSGHHPVVTEVPGPIDDIAPGEGMSDVLPGRPVEREAGIKDEYRKPAQVEEPEQEDKQRHGQTRLDPYPSHLSPARPPAGSSTSALAENAGPQHGRANRKQRRAQAERTARKTRIGCHTTERNG